MFKNYKRTRKKEASEIVSQKRLYLGDGGVISEWYTTVENVSNIFPFVCPLGSCTVLLMDNGNAARVGSVPTGPLQYHDENRASCYSAGCWIIQGVSSSRFTTNSLEHEKAVIGTTFIQHIATKVILSEHLGCPWQQQSSTIK